MWVDMFSGFIVSIYEAEDQAALEREFERLGFPWDEVHAVQVQMDYDTLERMIAATPEKVFSNANSNANSKSNAS